ncbi:hypothetical protein QQ054_35455 [Oscillatoria amoena NRMC-F 0135]|nr:MAG: hypothetical protein F9K23_08780 [Bacteroidota bacterium]MDL5051302.1 hypothetical protein [Oscillatoria amoena NRMC-F 0135]
MDIQTEKLQLMKMLLETEDKSILKQLKAVFDSRTKSDIWDEWDDEVRKDVEEAIAELDRGEGIPHAVVMQEFSKWRKK